MLAACDPAQPYGAALPWPDNPGRPSRAVGAQVVLRHGRPLAYLERGGHSLTLFPEAAERPQLDPGAGHAGHIGPAAFAGDPQGRRAPAVAERPDVTELLLGAGFRSGYRGPILRS